jgi:hypothetical protein
VELTRSQKRLAQLQKKYPKLRTGLMSDTFAHIDRRKRIEAEQGRNPTLWLLFEARLMKARRPSVEKAKALEIIRKRHPDETDEFVEWMAQVNVDSFIKMTRKYQFGLRFKQLARQPLPSRNTFIIGFENLPLMPDRQARPRSSAPGSRAATTDSGGGGPDEPDPDPDPERPYIALGIDHKATTPAGPPVPVSLRLFSLYRIEMRYCHEGDQPDHPEP